MKTKKNFKKWAKIQNLDITEYDNRRFYRLLKRMGKKVRKDEILERSTDILS
jgi:hypothetical protein